MRITNVSASAFKGREFNIPLAPVTALVGRNFAGKTAVLQALELGCTHAVAGVGSQPHVLFERLASGRSMNVAVGLDDGTAQAVRMELDRKGKVSCVTPGKPLLPSLLFDPNEFLSLSGPERSKFLFRTLPPPDLSKVGPAAIAANLKNWRGEPHNEHHERAVTALCQFVEEDHAAAARLGCPVQEWLEALAEAVRKRTNDAVAGARRFRSTIEGVVSLKEPDAASLASAEKAETLARAALDQAEAGLATTRERYARLKRDLDAATELASSWTPPEPGARAGLERLIAELRPKADEELPGHDLGPGPSMREVETKLKAATDMLNEAFTAKRLADAEVDRIERAIEQAEHATTCPTCGQDISEKSRAVARANREQLKAARKAQAGADAAHTSKIGVHAMAQGNHNDQNERLRVHLAREAELTAAFNARNEAREQARRRLRAAEGQLQALKDAEAKEAPALAAKESLPGLAADLALEGNHGRAQKEKAGLLAKAWGDAAQARREAVAEASKARTQAQAAAKADEADAEADVCKALASFLTELLALCVEQSVAPLLEQCNALCGGILTAPLAYRDGEIGMSRAGRFVSWRSFSGTERSLAFMALSVGLAAKSPVRLAVLDEVGRLDGENKVRLASAARALVAQGRLDQVVLVDTDVGLWMKLAEHNAVPDFICVEVK